MSEEKQSPKSRLASSGKVGKTSILTYLVILFAGAFVLLALAYFMDQRSNIDGLADSLSAMQSAQELYQENSELKTEIAQLNDQLEELEAQLKQQEGIKAEEFSALQEQVETLTDKVGRLEKTSQAMDWFWQINEAFVRDRYTLTRELIEEMGEDLVEYLPHESITDNMRFSPYDRYQEIYEALY